MITTVHKLFWLWDFDKEEKWLNEMAAKGLALYSVGYLKYEFRDCLPGEYSVRLSLLENSPRHPESVKYIEFIEETGAEQVGSFRRWVYFRKKKSLGSFELVSDLNARLKQLAAHLTLCLCLCLSNLLLLGSNLCIFIMNGFLVSLISCFVNAALVALTAHGALKLFSERRRLKRDSYIFE